MHISMNNIKDQKGLTLVELLIAMILGLFLVGGVLQVFLGTRQTYSTVTSQSQAQESGRFALHFLADGLRHAGYWGVIAKPRQFEENHSVFATENTIVVGVDNNSATDDVLNGTDELFIRMTGDEDGFVENCLGQSLTSTQVAVDHYYLSVPDVNSSENVSSLMCSTEMYDFDVDTFDIADMPSGPANTQALVHGIEDLQFLFGLIGPGGGDQAELYANATGVSDWRDVRSVRIAAIATSNDDSSGFENTADTQLLDKTVAAAGDRRTRLVFQQTTSLRNFIFKATSL